MGFQAPFVLFGLAAVGVPVAIHLLNQWRVRTVRWGAMRFLRGAVEKNRRRRRIEDLLLLVTRCLLVLALVLAFSRPVWNPEGALQTENGTSKVAVVILDQSASMDYSDGGRTLLESAKAAVFDFLDSLARESRVAVIFSDGRKSPLGETPSTDLVAIRKIIDSARADAGGTDWKAALEGAFGILKAYQGVQREVVVFTDNQSSGWENPDAIQRLLDDHPEIPVRVEILGTGRRSNLAITGLQRGAGPIVPGRPIRFHIDIENFGSDAQESVPLSLAVDGLPPSAGMVLDRIEPGQKKTASMDVVFDSPGPHTVTASMAADRLPADNARSMPVSVSKEVRLAFVEDRPDGRAAFFLSNALLPIPGDQALDSPVKIDFQTSRWIEDGLLEKSAAIFWINPENVSETAVRRLQAYLENGGVLFLFPAASTSPAVFNQGLGAVSSAFLSDPVTSPPLKWSAGPHTHPVTSFWNGKPGSSLESVVSKKHFPLKPAGPNSIPVVEFSDGSPCVVEGIQGAGRVYVFSSPPDPRWTNLPLNPNFVPLVQRLLSHAVSPGSVGTIAAGRSFQMEHGAGAIGREVLVESPGSPGRTSAGRVTKHGERGRIDYRNTDLPGPYRLFLQGGDHPVAAFAVQIPPGESDLSPLLGNPLSSQTAPQAASSLPMPPQRGGQVALWSFLIAAALFLALLESVMGHRFSLPR